MLELQGVVNASRLAAQLFRRELTGEQALLLDQRGVIQLLESTGYRFLSERLDDPELIKQLGVEYCRIFIGPGRHVAPYGSVHHPDDQKRGRLWGDSTVWVRRFAKDHGVDFSGPSYDGIPDHVGHELELYALLVEAELRAQLAEEDAKIERLHNSEKLLLDRQLNRWVPAFCAKVREAAELEFYAELARLTTDLLELENERLAGHQLDEGDTASSDLAPPQDVPIADDEDEVPALLPDSSPAGAGTPPGGAAS